MRASRLHQGLRFLPTRFRVEGLSSKVWDLELRVSGLRALVGFRVAAFRSNAPQRAEADDAKHLKLNRKILSTEP